MRRLSVIIVNYNTRDLLRDCLHSLEQYPPQDTVLEIVVVDNASSDGSVAMVEAEFPQVKLVASVDNLGFAGGNNRGLAEANGDFLLLLNPDTRAKAGALDAMLAFLRANPDAGAVGCKLVDGDGKLLPSGYSKLTLGVLAARLFHLKRLVPAGLLAIPVLQRVLPRTGHFEDYDLPRDVDVLIGACILARREVLEQVGGLDEGFFMYYEESDWCLRVRAAGWRVCYTPDGEIVHLVGQSAGKFKRITFLAEYDSLLRYACKHRPAVEVTLLRAMVLTKIIVLTAGAWLGSDARDRLPVYRAVFNLYVRNRPIEALQRQSA